MKSPLGARRVLTVVLLFIAVSTHIKAATVTIQAFSNFFTPANQTINVGDTVTWIFRASGHDTVSEDGLWSSGIKSANQTFSFTFNTAGSFGFFCTPHRFFGMTGTITVQGAANEPPTVSLTAPANGATFSTSDTITFSADASDDQGISKVEFFSGANLIGTDTGAPYSVTASLGAGSHSITAKATDTGNLTATSTARTITVNAPNQAPTVSLTSPANGATFTTADTITFSANAADDAGVSNVEFFSHGALLGSDNTAPYSITASLAAGAHEITARATDNSGASTTSPVVSITVNSPGTLPQITLTSPQADKTIAAPGTVHLSATATDDGEIVEVEFLRGRGVIASDITAPYEATSSDLGPGVYSFSAVARDNSGATTTSTNIEVRVAATPQIASVSRDGATITINASVTDAISHDLEGTIDFVTWNIVGTATPSGGVMSFTDNTGQTAHFYRVVAR